MKNSAQKLFSTQYAPSSVVVVVASILATRIFRPAVGNNETAGVMLIAHQLADISALTFTLRLAQS